MNNNYEIYVDMKDPTSYRYSGDLPAMSSMLEELLKTTEIQQLFESYYNLINIPVAIIDLNANVLLSSQWRRLCTQFHRVHPTTCDRCIESDTQLATQLQEGKTYTIYACRNGLTDCASPIIIEGKHIANVFVGQFLTKEPDEAWFRRQAEELDFDIADYLAALREVPIVDEEKIPVILDLLVRMTNVITKLSIDRKDAIENEKRHSTILNTIPQSIFWKDLNGRYLGCNAPFAKAAGLATPNVIVGKTDFDLPWPRQEAEAYRADDLAVISANEPRLHIIEPLQQADGSRIVIDTSKIPLIDATNTPYGIVGIYEDITERQKIEESLKLSEEKFRLSFMTGLDAFYWATLEEGRIIDINPVFEDVYGYTRDEVIGRTSLELGLYNDPDDRARMVSELKEKGFIKDLELKGNKKGGEIITISISISTVLINKQWHILGTIRDITERKQNEEAIRVSEKRYRETTDFLPISIFEIDATGRLISFNQTALKAFGYNNQDFNEDMNVLQFFAPEEWQQVGENMGKVMRGASIPGQEYTFIRKDGSTFIGLIYSSPIIHQNNATGIRGAIIDITERKQAEKEIHDLAMFPAENPNPVLRIGRDGTLLYINQAGMSQLTEWQLQVGQDVPSILKDVVSEVMNSGSVLLVDLEHNKRTFSFTIAPIIDAGYTTIYGSDITERKRAEELLRRSEEKFAKAFKESPIIFTISSTVNERLIEVNEAFEKIMGYTREEALASTMIDMGLWVNRADRERLLPIFLANGGLRNEEVQVRTKSGEVITCLFSAELIELDGEQCTLSAIENITDLKLAEDRINKEVARTKLLLELYLVASHMTDKELYDYVLEKAVNLTDSAIGFFHQVADNSKTIILKTWNAEALKSCTTVYDNHYPLDQAGNWVDCVRYKKPIVYNDFPNSPNQKGLPEGHTPLKRFMSIPVVVDNDVHVIFGVGNKKEEYNEHDVDQLQLVANELYKIIISRKAEANLKESFDQLQQALSGTVKAMATVVESRDPYTAGHQRRVAALAQAIASEMDLPIHQIEGVRMAAVIHDLGKIAVPAEILTKSTKLKKIEYKLIQEHSQSGYEILKDIEFPWPIARIVLEHHEKMDGSGYPNKLVGENILLEAKILTVADVVEAMASHRPYRPALGIDAALEEIEKNKGILYDPEVVEVCLKLFKEKGFGFE